MLRAIMRSNAVYHYPLWIVALTLIVASVVASLLLHGLADRIVPAGTRRRHNDVTGATLSVVGVTYAVLLAFVAMLAWENYDSAKSATSHEATRLLDVARTANGLPEPARAQLRADLVAYAGAVRNVEWPAQADGRTSMAAAPSLDQAEAAVLALHPTTTADGTIQAALLTSLTGLYDARDERLAAAARTIPGIVWLVVVAGGALTLVLASLLGAWTNGLRLVLAALVALSGTLVLVMILALSHPFRGDYRVTAEPFGLALTRMEER